MRVYEVSGAVANYIIGLHIRAPVNSMILIRRLVCRIFQMHTLYIHAYTYVYLHRPTYTPAYIHISLNVVYEYDQFPTDLGKHVILMQYLNAKYNSHMQIPQVSLNRRRKRAKLLKRKQVSRLTGSKSKSSSNGCKHFDQRETDKTRRP